MVIPIDLLALREARETLWYGLATVETIQSIKDPITKRTTQEFEVVDSLKDIPCKLSHKNKDAVTQSTTGPAILEHSIWISTGNEHNIPAGSRISVTQNGKTALYKQSGEPSMFLVHQEIPLIPYEDYS